MAPGRSVLGIDAAWTGGNPSGIALAEETASGWRLIYAGSSYDHFHAHAAGHPAPEKALGTHPDVPALLASCAVLLGRPVDLVAVDMPLSRAPITARRAADNAVTRAFGAAWCGTHSPSAARPGPLSDRMREAFAMVGYPLRTTSITTPGLIEVYPHPALLALTGAGTRLPYKEGNRGKYWPDLTTDARRAQLLETWKTIVSHLDRQLAGSGAVLGPVGPLKAYEDRLDAAICCWIGIEALRGNAIPYGDGDAAIWVPRRPA